MSHLLTLFDITPDATRQLLDRAAALKAELRATRGNLPPRLAGRTLGLLFEKPSLRTRVSFEAAMNQLGGASVFLGADVGWGARESLADFSRTLSCYVDGVVLRAGDHATVEQFSAFATCPVINGLTQLAHPCQALADLFTIAEVFGSLASLRVAFIGDGNNVARSLATGCAMMDASFVLAGPQDYQLDDSLLQQLAALYPKSRIETTDDPRRAVRDADIIYTDVWTSMGDEAQQASRRRDFHEYQVNGALVSAAPARARVMHCLPAHRGEEITTDIMDGERSIIFRQAENRLHVQKAILLTLLGQSQGWET